MVTVGTLSGFQEFFLQPIIKDRPNRQWLQCQCLKYIFLRWISKDEWLRSKGRWQFYGRSEVHHSRTKKGEELILWFSAKSSFELHLYTLILCLDAQNVRVSYSFLLMSIILLKYSALTILCYEYLTSIFVTHRTFIGIYEFTSTFDLSCFVVFI